MATDVRIKEQLPQLTRRIVQTYQDVPTIQYLGHCPLPKYETIIAACEAFFTLESARQYWRGKGGMRKGRAQSDARSQA